MYLKSDQKRHAEQQSRCVWVVGISSRSAILRVHWLVGVVVATHVGSLCRDDSASACGCGCIELLM